MIILRPKKEFKAPIIAECISPDVFMGKSIDEVAKLKVYEGNKERTLGELFNFSYEKEPEDKIMIIGDVSKVRKIGFNMRKGEIEVKGDVGMHLGAEMKGGKITVFGSAGSWAGSAMSDGLIEVHGSAGDFLGAPLRGSTSGMSGGTIVVHSNVGDEAGAYMRDGSIRIHGSAGQFLGLRMRGGAILVLGDADSRAGAFMTGGRIVICGTLRSLLPAFTIEGVRPSIKVGPEKVSGPFYLFVGDLTEGGDGQLFVSKVRNPHLSPLVTKVMAGE